MTFKKKKKVSVFCSLSVVIVVMHILKAIGSSLILLLISYLKFMYMNVCMCIYLCMNATVYVL